MKIHGRQYSRQRSDDPLPNSEPRVCILPNEIVVKSYNEADNNDSRYEPCGDRLVRTLDDTKSSSGPYP